MSILEGQDTTTKWIGKIRNESNSQTEENEDISKTKTGISLE